MKAGQRSLSCTFANRLEANTASASVGFFSVFSQIQLKMGRYLSKIEELCQQKISPFRRFSVAIKQGV
jgi:hypothetical protein